MPPLSLSTPRSWRQTLENGHLCCVLAVLRDGSSNRHTRAIAQSSQSGTVELSDRTFCCCKIYIPVSEFSHVVQIGHYTNHCSIVVGFSIGSFFFFRWLWHWWSLTNAIRTSSSKTQKLTYECGDLASALLVRSILKSLSIEHLPWLPHIPSERSILNTLSLESLVEPWLELNNLQIMPLGLMHKSSKVRGREKTETDRKERRMYESGPYGWKKSAMLTSQSSLIQQMAAQSSQRRPHTFQTPRLTTLQPNVSAQEDICETTGPRLSTRISAWENLL